MGLAPITTGHWPFSDHLNSWQFFSLWPDSSRVATIDRFHCIDTVQTFSGENPIRMVITSQIKCVLLGTFTCTFWALSVIKVFPRTITVKFA